MLDEFAFSCGTPSMYVVIAGLAGLAPIPRNRALLSFRAENSVKIVLGAKSAASLTMRIPARSIVSFETAVTLTGSFCASSGSFCAVTVTGGNATRSGSSGTGCDAAACPAVAGSESATSAKVKLRISVVLLFSIVFILPVLDASGLGVVSLAKIR